MNVSSAVGLLMLLVSVCVWLAGCASNGSGIIHSMPDRMDGLFLELTVQRDKDSIAYYNVKKDGTIGFAGGVEAKRGDIEWTDALTDEERNRIVSMVESFGWLEREPASSAINPEHRYELLVRQGSKRSHVIVRGDHPQLVEMSALLEQICSRRFDEFIDRLPQPGMQPK